MKVEKIEEGMRIILEGLEVDINNQHLIDTPVRVAKAYYEMFEGLRTQPPKLKVFHEKGVDQMIVSDNIPFYSFCSHHFLPFRGNAKIGYIPQDGNILGLSKLARVLDYFSKRPSAQEIITNKIADFLFNDNDLHPIGVGVVLEASHDCEILRGVKKEGSVMKTSALRGSFIEDKVREEFLKL